MRVRRFRRRKEGQARFREEGRVPIIPAEAGARQESVPDSETRERARLNGLAGGGPVFVHRTSRARVR